MLNLDMTQYNADLHSFFLFFWVCSAILNCTWMKVFSLLTEFSHSGSIFLYHFYCKKTKTFSVPVQSWYFIVIFTLDCRFTFSRTKTTVKPRKVRFWTHKILCVFWGNQQWNSCLMHKPNEYFLSFRVLRYLCGCLQKKVASKWSDDPLIKTRVVRYVVFQSGKPVGFVVLSHQIQFLCVYSSMKNIGFLYWYVSF